MSKCNGICSSCTFICPKICKAHAAEPFRIFLNELGFQVGFDIIDKTIQIEATKGKTVYAGFLEENELRCESSKPCYLDAMKCLFKDDVFKATKGLETSLWVFKEVVET
jgi:hypothetical protein